jgi:DNA-binding beta-propeller fold protein YncE
MTATIVLFLLAAAPAPALAPMPLPGGEGGIGFDDLLYSKALDKVLVPGGRSGRLDLVDPKTGRVDTVEGFTTSARFGGGHGQGTTSADSGRGLVFASDRDRRVVQLVDVNQKKIVGSADLAGGPDYVRWVEPTGEVWVTEPSHKAIEYFTLSSEGGAPKLVHAGSIDVKGGPESLVVDATRGRAYTHTWQDSTVAIDLKTHREVARWTNGCEGSRGIALDEARGLLFVGCEEGKAVALDVAHDGKRVGSAPAGKGVDIIAYSAQRQHLYVPGGDAATLTVIAVDPGGALRVLKTVPAAADAHCVAADPLGHAYVCDPSKGRLLVFTDDAP